MHSKGFGALSISLILGMGTFSSAAWAELPDAAKKMLDTAIAGGDQAVIQVVAGTIIQTYPDDADEVRAYLDAAQSEQAGKARTKIEEAQQKAEPVVPKVTIVPPPKPKPLPPTGFIGLDGWGGDVQLSGSLNTGNTSEKTVGLALDLSREGKSVRHFFKAAFDFTRTDGVTSKRRLRLGYEIHLSLSDRDYIFGTAEYVDDKFSGYSYRIIAAGGYGRRLLDSDNLSWDLEAGPGYRFSKINSTNESSKELVGRGSSKFRWKISDTAKFSNDISVLYSSTTTTFHTLSAFNIAINSHLSGQLSFETNTDTHPPVGTKKTDTQTKAALVYGF